MKRLFLLLPLTIALSARLFAGGASSVYINASTLTSPTNIDASVFINRGAIVFDLLGAGVADQALFQTHDTLDFTNDGTMFGQPGFLFQTVTGSTVHPAANFTMSSAATLQAVDAPLLGYFFLLGTVPELLSPLPTLQGENSATPGNITILASNINLAGNVAVGDFGSLNISGATLNLSTAFIKAGTISEVDTNALTGRGAVIGVIQGGTIYPTFSPAVDVYDIAWATTNGFDGTGDITDLQTDLGTTPLEIPDEGSLLNGTRNGTIEGNPNLVASSYYPGDIFPFGALQLFDSTNLTMTTPLPPPNFQAFAYAYDINTNVGAGVSATNYLNVVLLNTAFPDTNITASVEFLPAGDGDNILTNLDPNAEEVVIKFSTTVFDIASGAFETNSIYFLDTSAFQPAINATNSDYSQVAKPLGFEITRVQPIEWTEGVPFNATFDPSELYISGEYQNVTALMTNAFYMAEVGRNPEQSYGLSDYAASVIGTTETGMPYMTNEGARVNLTASKTNNIKNTRLVANGPVTITASNLVGSPVGTDFGNLIANIGNVKGNVTVSNLFPGTFQRVRGSIGAYSATWANVQTNDGVNPGAISNVLHFHVLVVDQDLRDLYRTTALSVALHGSNVTLADPLRVINSATFQAANLTVNNSVELSGAANALQTANFPGLKNLLVGPNGSINADSSIIVGVPQTAGPVTVTARNTPILSITNLGLITSGVIEWQSQVYANGGTNQATNGGSITINCLTNYLGAGSLGATNALIADGDVALAAASIQVTNSTIAAGQDGIGQLVLQAGTELTDHHPNSASTNAYNTNQWAVTDGFSLAKKPVKGDLFGTKITTLAAAANRTIDHVWAGQDLGASAAGFFNNEVIGHLVLDRTAAGATFHFKAAGARNAMYVDYLDLEDLAITDYHDGLAIDPNFTIYFADANVDPEKLHQVYSNLVWVPQFAGPNSTTIVKYSGGSNCLMNAALASSATIDTDGDGIVNQNDTFPLNNASVGAVPCPSLVTASQAEIVTNGVADQQFVLWTTGQGVVSPALPAAGLQAGQHLTLTATPAPGWLFLGWSGAVVSSSAMISFEVPAAPFDYLTANFITNPFIGLSGTFNGLFSTGGNVGAASSGAVTFTLNSQGIFSGKLTMGATNLPFSSRFNIANTAAFNVTNGHSVFPVTLQVGLSAQADEATGTVQFGAASASLIAYHTPGWTAANPSLQRGSYRIVLPGNLNAAVAPAGDSYATVTVDALGNLKLVGTLADGTAVSENTTVSKEGQWPLYLAPTSVPERVQGWIVFDTNGVGGTPAEMSGGVAWIKLAKPGQLYPNGFTNGSTLIGSTYSAGLETTSGLGLTGPTITLRGGNLPGTVSESVNLVSRQSYQSADGKLKLTINPTTGGFSGQYLAPGAAKAIPLTGVVLQNQGTAQGFFLGASQSGEVVLSGS